MSARGDFKPYPAYKDSGFEWLGAVPTDWGIRRLGSVTAPISRRGHPELPLLSVVRERGVVRRETVVGNHNVIPEDLSAYKVVEVGDLAINKMKAWQGSLGVSDTRGIVSPAYYVYRLNVVNPRYMHALLRSPVYVGAFAAESTGVRVGQWDLSPTGLKAIPVLTPPPEEQAAIVRYLDHVDTRIQRLVAAKETLISLLEEEKRTIIRRAVTRGIDGSVTLKHSGIPWIGEIPEHWDLVPNRSLLRVKKQNVGKQSADHVLLSLTKRGIIARDMDNPEGKFPGSFDTYQIVEPGDFVFCLFDVDETPRAVGRSALTGMITGAYTRFVCRDPAAAPFIELFYQAMDDGKLLKPLYSGLRKVIRKESFLAAKMPVPPEAERSEIVESVRRLSSKINTAVVRAKREIDLLREYRARLISDAVTGKLDVREAAANLRPASDNGPTVYDTLRVTPA